jgi:hypothetical protein
VGHALTAPVLVLNVIHQIIVPNAILDSINLMDCATTVLTIALNAILQTIALNVILGIWKTESVAIALLGVIYVSLYKTVQVVNLDII